jgi:hypothetical protein
MLTPPADSLEPQRGHRQCCELGTRQARRLSTRSFGATATSSASSPVPFVAEATAAIAAALRCDPGGGERGSATYCPATISNGDTQVTGSCTLLQRGQVRTCVPVRRLPSPERHSETVICQELTQERPGLQ